MEHVSDKHHDQAFKQSPVQYFLPGQMVFHVTHQVGLNDAQINGLMAWSNGLAGKAAISFRRELRFPATSQPPEYPPPGEGINRAMVNPLSRFTLIFADVENTDNLLGLITLLDNKREDQPVAGLALELVSPNWLMSGAPHGIGTGGPGSWPVEAHPPDGDSWKFRLQTQQDGVAQLPFADGPGEGMHVAILDTAPSKNTLDRAYAEWHWGHPLIENLLKPGGPLNVYPATYADLHLTADYSLLGHRYLMRDHGLFVAGIIHTIAPKATLHLFEVLNPYGVGCIETIALGLLQVLENGGIGRPLIFNCSFTLGVPGDGKFDPGAPVGLRNPNIGVGMLFDWLANQKDVVVVAAAGNDAQYDNNGPNRNSRPDARHPASFSHVLGVGASPKGFPRANGRYRAATYSNLSDQPTERGYMTLGGEPGPGQGVLGVYIGEFPTYAEGCLSLLWRIFGWAGRGHLPPNPHTFTPDRVNYKRNTTGWAWWAGTSFATPIISGILASWRSQPGNRAGPFQFPNAQQALNGLSQPIKTDKDEEVILVMQ